MDIVAILQKRKQKLRSLKMQLKGERPKYGLPKPWTAIQVKFIIAGDGLVRKYVDEAVKDSAEKYCSVGATLSPTAKVTYSYEIVD